jgi:hypothetical protein
MAKEQGVSDDTIQAVFEKRMPLHAPADEKLTIEVCRALHETQELRNRSTTAPLQRGDEQGLMDIIQTIGFYTFVVDDLERIQHTHRRKRPYAVSRSE